MLVLASRSACASAVGQQLLAQDNDQIFDVELSIMLCSALNSKAPTNFSVSEWSNLGQEETHRMTEVCGTCCSVDHDQLGSWYVFNDQDPSHSIGEGLVSRSCWQ